MLDLPALLTSIDAPTEEDRPASVTARMLCAEAPRLRRLVHRLLGWQARAGDLDDVVQDVLLAAWRHRGTFRGEAAFSTWLWAIALRTTQNWVRRASLRRRLFGWLTGEPAAPAGSDPSAGPNERLDATQLAMAKLAHADREVLVLRYLEQRAIPQIADLLGCSRAAVDARLSRARARLRASLGLEDGP